MTQFTVHQAASVQGEYVPPGDKSISHRVVMLGALADGKSTFSNLLEGQDCVRTIEAFKAMGAGFLRENQKWTIDGVGLRGLRGPAGDLDLGNSGTTMRLLLGILAGQNFEVTLTGDESLVKRPMRRVTDPLREMGAEISGRDGANFAPLKIKGGKLKGIHWINPVSSAQVKSSILLAGLNAEGETAVEEAIVSRDHTERLLTRFGVKCERRGHLVAVQRAERLHPVQFHVPGDISSAAFFLVAAAILPGSDVLIKQVGLNPTRTGIIDILKAMGADISVTSTHDYGEPAGEIRVRGTKLKGISIDPQWIPSLIDELPVIMIACALAEGTSTITGAAELRVKETDRIQSMTEGLNAIGGKARPTDDGCVIEGVKSFRGGVVQSYGDHRTAMSFAVAALRSDKGVTVQDTDCILTSYPHFERDLKHLTRA